MLGCREHDEQMQQRAAARREQRRSRSQSDPEQARCTADEPFAVWFPNALKESISRGDDIEPDVMMLGSPPSYNARSYRAMYAYGNHYRTRASEVDLLTCDSGVAATFATPCRASSSDRNISMGNVEYIGSIEEIIGVDYGGWEIIVLYCNWVQAVMAGPRATMKHDEYGFTLVNFDRCMPHSVNSFAFPVQVQQVFFADITSQAGWKVVLRKDPRSTRVASSTEMAMPEIQSLHIGNAADHPGLLPTAATRDLPLVPPTMADAVVMTVDDVQAALQAEEGDEDFEEGDPEHANTLSTQAESFDT